MEIVSTRNLSGTSYYAELPDGAKKNTFIRCEK